MLLKTYVTVTLFLAGAPQALARRAEAKRAEDGGLATLEWVALASSRSRSLRAPTPASTRWSTARSVRSSSARCQGRRAARMVRRRVGRAGLGHARDHRALPGGAPRDVRAHPGRAVLPRPRRRPGGRDGRAHGCPGSHRQRRGGTAGGLGLPRARRRRRRSARIRPSASVRTATTATVTVTGRTMSLVPGLPGWSVSQTASGPVERFTRAGQP